MVSDAGLEGFNSEEDRFLFAEAHLGIELENFLRTNVGRYLRGRCEGVVQEFNAWVLGSVDPEREEFRKRHLEARAAQMVMKFISEAVVQGQHAQQALEERDAEEAYSDGPLAP